jgi:beta-lactamase superfamily II metal-dependent hydrolase
MPNFYVLDVGKGNSAVLVDTEGVIVIDAGSQTDLLTFLIEHNINTVNVLLLWHTKLIGGKEVNE